MIHKMNRIFSDLFISLVLSQKQLCILLRCLVTFLVGDGKTGTRGGSQRRRASETSSWVIFQAEAMGERVTLAV
jgi:hypothetical protein